MPDGEFRILHGEESRCEALAEALSAYVDDALDSVLRQEVETHLRTCPSCAAEVSRLQQLAAELRDLALVHPPAVVWERIRYAAGQPPIGGAGRAGMRGGVLALLSQWVLAGYDGELADRVRETGSCREREGSPHGKVALLAGVILGLHTLASGTGLSVVGGLAGTILVWLASTRLESRLSLRGLLGALFLGAVGPAAWEFARASAGPDLGLSAAVAALATAQYVLFPRLKPRVLGLFHVPCLARTAAMLLLAGAVARPDLTGPFAAFPVVAGAAGGALATWAQTRRRAA